MSPISALFPAGLAAAYDRARDVLTQANWQGLEGEIARTGEEDPLANVDDPDLAAVIAAKMADRHRALVSYERQPEETALAVALDKAEMTLAQALAANDREGAFAALAALSGPIDAFFAQVELDESTQEQQRGRLELLDRFVAAVHNGASGD